MVGNIQCKTHLTKRLDFGLDDCINVLRKLSLLIFYLQQTLKLLTVATKYSVLRMAVSTVG